MKELLGGLGLRMGLLALICASSLAIVGNSSKHPEARLSALDLGFRPSECSTRDGAMHCVSATPLAGCALLNPDCRIERASLGHDLMDRPAVTLAKLDQRMARHSAVVERQPEGVSYALPSRPD